MDEGKTREQPVSEPEALRRELAVEKAAGISGRRLREEQERFAKAFIENSTPMVITTLEEGRIIDVSDAFLKLIGFERRQLIGATSVAVGLLTAEQRENLLRELGQRGRVENLEMPIGTHKQGVRQVLMNASVILIGAEKFLLSVFTDITNRKRMEEALQANEWRFRTVYENTTLGIFETTLSGRVINANETFARMFGFASARQAVSELDDLAARIYADPRQRGEIITRVLHEPGPHRFELAYRRRDGGFFPAVLEIQSVWDREDNDYHFFGFVEDITRRKKAEEGQRIAEELYRTLAEKSFAGVYVVQDGCFRFINANAAQIAGYAREELLDRPTTMLVHPEDRDEARRHAVEMLRGRREAPYEFRIVTKAGETRWVMETVTAINYLGSPAILGNSMDITVHKSAAEERERLISRLQEALADVKRLSGLLPICASCKKIRNDKGYWENLEEYIRDRSEAEFSHSICPECVKKLYPGLSRKL